MKCEMSWLEQTLFLFMPPQENDQISVLLENVATFMVSLLACHGYCDIITHECEARQHSPDN